MGFKTDHNARSKIVFACGVLVLAGSFTSVAQQRPEIKGAESEKTSQADALFRRFDAATPGCSAAVVNAGDILYEHAAGMANIELGVPLTTESVFGIASTSKQFTAMSIVLLALRGKLSLGDEIHKYIPELPRYRYPIRIEQLLHHTSGIKDADELLEFAGFRPPFDLETKQMYLDMILRQRELNFVPGSEFLYSNSNYFLLSLIVERVSGKPFATFAQQEIFGPLAMTHTQLRDDASRVISKRAFGYDKAYHNPSDGYFHDADDHVQVLGEDGVFTTIQDLAKWDRNFYEFKVGGQEAVARMLQTTKLNDGTANQYAGGLEIGSYRGLKTAGHDGGGFGTSSDFLRFPEQRMTFVVLCNFRDEDEHDRDLRATLLARKLADIYLQSEFPTRPPASNSQSSGSTSTPPKSLSSTDSLRAFVGYYWDRRTTIVRRFEVREGRLWISVLPGGNPADLENLGRGKFRLGPATLTFSKDGAEVEASQPGGPPNKLWRVPDPQGAKKTLNNFTGSFYSADIDSTWKFVASGDHFVMRRKYFPDEEMIPAFGDAFFCGVANGALIHFVRTDSGKVVRADVMNRHMRRIRFAKLG